MLLYNYDIQICCNAISPSSRRGRSGPNNLWRLYGIHRIHDNNDNNDNDNDSNNYDNNIKCMFRASGLGGLGFVEGDALPALRYHTLWYSLWR